MPTTSPWLWPRTDAEMPYEVSYSLIVRVVTAEPPSRRAVTPPHVSRAIGPSRAALVCRDAGPDA
jgi:hypothetical protein